MEPQKTLVIDFTPDELAFLLEVCERVQLDGGYQRAEDLKEIRETPAWASVLGKLDRAMAAMKEVTV